MTPPWLLPGSSWSLAPRLLNGSSWLLLRGRSRAVYPYGSVSIFQTLKQARGGLWNLGVLRGILGRPITRGEALNISLSLRQEFLVKILDSPGQEGLLESFQNFNCWAPSCAMQHTRNSHVKLLICLITQIPHHWAIENQGETGKNTGK